MKTSTLLLVVVMGFFSKACASIPEKIKNSPNFKDGEFSNTADLPAKSFWTFLAMRLTTDYAEWPDWVEFEDKEGPPERVTGDQVRVTFINHATLLIQSNGINILTDPHFTKRCSPVSWAGPARVHKPGVRFENLPPIDVVVISHDHYDHLDTKTIEMLKQKHDPKFFFGLGVGDRISDITQNFKEMDWWEVHDLNRDTRIHFVEVQHFSGRSLTDRNSTLWGGFILELGLKKIYFGGDSGYGTHYKRVFERYGAMDLAMLPIGAYSPRDFMGPMHVDPEQAVQAHLDLRSKKSIGMHFGTFQLTAEEIDEPVKLLKKEKKKQGLSKDDFISLKPGEFIEI